MSSEVIISGVPVTIVDTAGVVSSKNPIEREGVLRTTKKVKRADLVLSLSAPGVGEVSTGGKKKISVFNKTDTLKEKPINKNVFYICAKNGKGVEKLLSKIENEVIGKTPSTNSTINNLRQHSALKIVLSLFCRQKNF